MNIKSFAKRVLGTYRGQGPGTLLLKAFTHIGIQLMSTSNTISSEYDIANLPLYYVVTCLEKRARCTKRRT